jgi:hypothetical protein
MAISNRYSSLERPALIITEYRFVIHSMRKGIRKLQQVFHRDPTVGSKVMAISNRYSSLTRPDLIITEYRSSSTPCKRASGNSSKSLTAIQRSDQNLWIFQTVNQAWRDQTSKSPTIHSSSTQWKRASGNSSKSLTAIQRSDQKLWPFRTVTQAWRDQTSSSLSIHSSSTRWKMASGNSSKSLTAIQRSDQSYGHLELLLKLGATSPHHHRVSIPHPLHAKGHSESPVGV